MRPRDLRVIEMPRGHCAGGHRCWKCMRPIQPHEPYGATYEMGKGARARWHPSCPSSEIAAARARTPREW